MAAQMTVKLCKTRAYRCDLHFVDLFYTLTVIHDINSTLSYCQDNININEAANCLVKHIIASEEGVVKSVVPDIISPKLSAVKDSACSGCFKG